MLILGIETSTQQGSVALWDTGTKTILTETVFPDEPSHARDIIPAIDQTFSDSNTFKNDVEAVAVSQGPGSFTGLRIGVTCAKTIAYILQWTCLGVSSLEALAYACSPAEYTNQHVCPVRDARRSAIYGNVFVSDGEQWVDQTGVMLTAPSDLVQEIPENTVVFGDAVDAYPDIFESPHIRIHNNRQPRPHAGSVARIGTRQLGENKDVPPMQLNPRYYRKTAAEDDLRQ